MLLPAKISKSIFAICMKLGSIKLFSSLQFFVKTDPAPLLMESLFFIHDEGFS